MVSRAVDFAPINRTALQLKKMALPKYLGVIALALAASACSTSPHVPMPSGEPFVGVAAPVQGRALLYVLRPGFLERLAHESPSLLVDGTRVAALGYDQFVLLELDPGQHVISLQPNPREASIWRTEVAVSLRPESVSFVAVWNVIEGVTQWNFVPVASGIIVLPPTTAFMNKEVRVEQVLPSDALLALQTMRRAAKLPM